jgi:hypothetical protein
MPQIEVPNGQIQVIFLAITYGTILNFRRVCKRDHMIYFASYAQPTIRRPLICSSLGKFAARKVLSCTLVKTHQKGFMSSPEKTQFILWGGVRSWCVKFPFNRPEIYSSFEFSVNMPETTYMHGQAQPFDNGYSELTCHQNIYRNT